MLIRQLLQHRIRKDVLSANKKTNHKCFRDSLPFWDRLLYVAKYHKKKLIALVLLATISYVYDMHQTIYLYALHKYSFLLSPSKLLKSIGSVTQQTVKEQSLVGIDLQPQTINNLIEVYYAVDSQLFFGMGRNYLFKIYSGLGLLVREDEQSKFWHDTGFYMKRNQMASGVGLREFMLIFRDGYHRLRKTNNELTQSEVLRLFLMQAMQHCVPHERWEQEFIIDREKQFLKNLIGQGEKKQEIILKLLRENTEINEGELEQRIQGYGMKGLSLADRHLYWSIRKVLLQVREYSLIRKASSMTASLSDSQSSGKALLRMREEITACASRQAEILQEYLRMYGVPLLASPLK